MYKTIVVHIDGGPGQESRLRAAALLAVKYGAHLVGSGATGISWMDYSLLTGSMAAPVIGEFLKVALADKPAVPFRVPAGIKLIRVDAKSGVRVGAGGSESGRVILEAFKPGTAPPDSYSVVGYTDPEGRPVGGGAPGQGGYISPDADRAVRGGSGLY